ncbi:response regulator [Hydrogenophaga sp.]|uniref:response regulator n=1 Tax=Hydrogenophaga sp. TaxID=1904254 RepID=UPI003562C0AF
MSPLPHAAAGAAPVSPPLPTGMLVVDDHDLVRLGLRSLVQAQAAQHHQSINVLESRCLAEALQLYASQEASIGLVLLDLQLPDAHGLNALTRFRQRFPRARIVVLSGTQDPRLVRQALDQGAQAFLTKSGDLQEVIGYIRSLGMWQQEPTTPAGTTAPAAERKVQRRNASGQLISLSERQAQVLDWILAGQSNREIAQHAQLSEGTVKNHVSTLLLLFGLRSRAQLISLLR